MEGQFLVAMEGGSPWGFTLQGGVDFRSPLQVGRVSFLSQPRALSCVMFYKMMKIFLTLLDV